EDARDVGVRDERRDLGLVDEHLDEVVVGRQVRQDALHRDQVRVTVAIEGLGAEDLGHAAEGDAIHEVIAAELMGPRHAPRYHCEGPPRVLTRPVMRSVPILLALVAIACSTSAAEPTPAPAPTQAPAQAAPSTHAEGQGFKVDV